MFSKFFISFFAMTLTTPMLSKADILFIDFNLNEKEVAAAQRAADQRGEKLVIFPEASVEVRKYIDDSTSYRSQISKNISNCKNDDICISKNLALYERSLDEQASVLAKIPFNVDVLTSFLEKMDQEGRNFTAFIESGHAGAERFSGFFPAIEHIALIKAVEGKASLSNVKTVLYWGCYSMSIGTVKNHWSKMFPKAHLIAGFDQVGPSGERKASASLLEQMLLNEDAAIATGVDLVALKVFFKNIPYSTITNFAMSIDFNTYVSNHNSVLISQAEKLCSADKANEYATQAAIVKCFADATDPACVNPPLDAYNGVLGKSYSTILSLDFCFEQGIGLSTPVERVDPEFVLRMRFYTNVKNNYAKFHRSDLQHLDEAMLAAGVSPDLLLGDIAKLSRAEIVRRLATLEKLTILLDQKILSSLESIRMSLVNLNKYMLPQSWIEVDASEGIPTTSDTFKL